MAVTYGIDYPFRNSNKGDFVKMTETPEREIRANLIHLLLTRKGSRYYLPDFGTRIYEYIFEQNDVVTFNLIEEEIRVSDASSKPYTAKVRIDYTANNGSFSSSDFIIINI
jgi:phage baseplate assembly protein W